MADLEKLVVALEARTKSFEAAMNKSRAETNRTMAAIEKRTKEASRDVSAALGTIGTTIRGVFTAATLAAIRTAIGNVADLADAAERVGVSTKALQEFRYAVQLSGGSIEQADGGLTKFVKNLSDASRGTGELGKVFRANGVSITDANGNLISASDALSRYSELVRNAKNPQDQLNLAVIGFGKDAGAGLVNALRDGAAGLEATSRRAEELGAILDDSVIAKARALDDRFTELGIVASTWAKTLAVEIADVAIPAMQDLLTLAGRLVDAFGSIKSFGTPETRAALENLAAGQSATIRGETFAATPDRMAVARSELLKRGGTPLQSDLSSFYSATGFGAAGQAGSTRRSTVTPTTLPSGGSGSIDAFERETQSIRKRTAELGLEAAALGKSTFEAEKARVQLDLESAARQAGIKLTAAQKIQIDQLSTSYATAALTLESAQKHQAALNDLQTEFKSATMDLFGSLIDGGRDFEQVLASIAKRIAEAALQAALFGEGPLRGLFGGSGGTGGGGLIGTLGGLVGGIVTGGASLGQGGIGHRAGGGPVQAGRPYIVGENRPELFVPKQSGMILPSVPTAVRAPAASSGDVINMPLNIDARGSTPDSVALLEKRLPGIVLQTLNQARRRGAA